MSGLQRPGDICNPLHDHIRRPNGVAAFNEMMESMLAADCAGDSDRELAGKLFRIIESGELHISQSMALLEAACRLGGNTDELLTPAR
jgi:hypothetical protein